jgi:hypothetical protein
MGIDSDPWYMMPLRQIDIRGFSSHTREAFKFHLHRRDHAGKIISYLLRHRLDIPGLGTVQSNRTDHRFKIAQRCCCIILKRAISIKKRLSDLIHRFIGGLRAQDDGHEQIEVARVMELAFGLRKKLANFLENHARMIWITHHLSHESKNVFNASDFSV